VPPLSPDAERLLSAFRQIQKLGNPATFMDAYGAAGLYYVDATRALEELKANALVREVESPA
jgi:hypothetical protein